MPAQLTGFGLPIRPAPSRETIRVSTVAPINVPSVSKPRTHKHSRSSYSESSPLVSRNSSHAFRPFKRQMSTPDKTIAVINASGRQAASLIRNCTAVGYYVRAQLRNLEGVVATEVSTNPNVHCIVGELYTRTKPTTDANRDVTQNGPISGVGINHNLIDDLFRDVELAFINTTFYGDEVNIGKAIVDAAKRAGVQYLVYSSMPDHSSYNKDWESLPLWAAKQRVEEYIVESGIPSTFVYTGIYNNNFTSLKYPLFCMDLQRDGSFVWQAPFHPNVKLPWLDAEHDVGPAILQVFKDGPKKWGGKRIGLAYELLTPIEACQVFSKGVGRPVKYIQGPIEVEVPIPTGYREQLEALGRLFSLGKEDPTKQPPYFGDAVLEKTCIDQSMQLWEGPRGLEEYAREVFPLEEQANGMRWMDEEESLSRATSALNINRATIPLNGGSNGGIDAAIQPPPTEDEEQEDDEYSDEDDDDDGLVMKARKRDEEQWLA
ncbi:Nitrogen metabolite repression protein nmr [Ceratocystis lukuohia]|uniref:Nitrogen metabolite repression protein nmr n=2 Tax=Ceratocystis TaxID=5157 RepID=A0A2C5X3V9_9PEZI|nr:Nitrogen metabolite repression protein nmr [Ceratocystis fimbriata CBS 114723]